MSGYYNQRPVIGGPMIKKARMGPRGPHPMQPSHHPGDDMNRLMSFKEFILKQNNDINEQDALIKYSEYKTDFIKRQIDRFFKEHQEEEWFRNKYRPMEIKAIEDALKQSKEKRRELFNKLMEKYNPDEIVLDHQHREQVSKFMSDFSILLEGASVGELDDLGARKNYEVSSLFMPYVHPSVDKAMIEEYASTRPDFLRVAMSEAFADRGYTRRAWISFKRMDPESLKKLAWDYNNHKFNGQETKALINKESEDRIKYAHHLFQHTETAKADIKNIARLLTHFDGEDCPLLDDLKEHLIEETNEDEKILGLDTQDTTSQEFKHDPKVFNALDRAILYLRAVHFFDYYAATAYTSENEMPQRIGIMNVRPDLPPNHEANPTSLKEFSQSQKTRIDAFLDKPVVSETEQKQLGRKNADEEIDNFIFQHTQEKKGGLKFVCKLTKKKFTGPEFVRKHILTRCSDKLDEVRTNVEFLNNYIADPKRPM